ncbi:MAG: undecaprenyldiphospho-muramoylpentapeptide beta-N-acetylglucosaminyltransferase [Prevotella sp.]|nr:undecaprenyldiphospho-muramoylpentapeptide beta-N-acetylglucosaminyltransferase [Prevotella sp.]MCM1075050.1 undecaprenyldiphospho-muramoylpentapeptide beta-N-acetylglucosaminyltransferase [Ruminococcus sp.]
MRKDKPKFIISGGGTGGHIFPALSIAGAIKRRWPAADILFVGAQGRMEMEKVPAAGFPIEGLPVAGFNRKNLLKNFSVLLKLRKSLSRAKAIVKEFAPDAVIGVGGYASGPTLKSAQRMGIPTLLQEQNSYAGVTNKLLAKKAKQICVAYPDMERFFPADKIVLTGNPVRKEILDCRKSEGDARRSFGLEPDIPTVLVVGGSLGARTLNESIQAALPRFADSGIQLIWQTGKAYGDIGIKAVKGMKGVVATQFLTDMATAYRAATLVVSRAGAGSISELELLGKPCILVPSPNVAEDHQTKNARALSDRGAAITVPDSEARAKLADTIFATMADNPLLDSMSREIKKLALPHSDEIIVDKIEQLLR